MSFAALDLVGASAFVTYTSNDISGRHSAPHIGSLFASQIVNTATLNYQNGFVCFRAKTMQIKKRLFIVKRAGV